MKNPHHFIFRIRTNGTNELVYHSACMDLAEAFAVGGDRSLQLSNLMALTICPYCLTQLFIEVERTFSNNIISGS